MAAEPGLAFAFPGVGVRFSGMEVAFAERRGAVLALLEEASRHAGTDLCAALRAGGTEGLSELDAQRFSFAFGCGVAEVVRDAGRAPSFVVGYSHGVYAAVVAAGALPFGDGLACVDRAWSSMRAACPAPCGLGVVVGLDRAEVERCLEDAVRVVNENHDRAFVIAGPDDALDRALARASGHDALKALRLRAGLPYHHPVLLGAAVPELAAFLETLAWREPACPVLSCIDQAGITDAKALREHVAQNIATPIDWRRTVEAMGALGVSEVVECGVGISLTQSARMIDGAPRFVPLRKLASGAP